MNVRSLGRYPWGGPAQQLPQWEALLARARRLRGRARCRPERSGMIDVSQE